MENNLKSPPPEVQKEKKTSIFESDKDDVKDHVKLEVNTKMSGMQEEAEFYDKSPSNV
jgi:hypothetical protein